MPYGLYQTTLVVVRTVSFNPSYGLHALRALRLGLRIRIMMRFNPSYGLHALRAWMPTAHMIRNHMVSIPHMGCMPYGLNKEYADPDYWIRFQSLIWVACPTGEGVVYYLPHVALFQSLIWVACPTGGSADVYALVSGRVSIPHMGCMPYGPQRRSRALPSGAVSIPHMGCMPYGPYFGRLPCPLICSFNPSYGLHALRAAIVDLCAPTRCGFNPSYGLHALRAIKGGKMTKKVKLFQSLIWVACPTGFLRQIPS